MQFEVIRKSHNKKVVIGVVAIILIAVVLLVRNSFAKYQTTKSLKIVEGTINYIVPDFDMVAMYQQKDNQTCTTDSCYNAITKMPTSGYKINETKSYCNINNVKDIGAKIYTNEAGEHVISSLQKGSKCYVYFDKVIPASNIILANVTVKKSSDSFTRVATTNEGVFKTQDDDGDTYYFRGAVENNYVKFAGLYWRIIRINGDGTIRMIYDGDTARANGSKLTVDTSTFNSSHNNNMYVGFKYTSDAVHGTGTNSTILDVLNTWYTKNLDGYTDKIDVNAGFCNDREPSKSDTTSNGSGGTGTTATYYGAYIRFRSGVNWRTTQNPTYKCKNISDLFTKHGAVKKVGLANGNGTLTNPIGLITADEVIYAGGFGGTANSSYYLYTGQNYFTMSPSHCSGSMAHVFIVYADGYLYSWRNSGPSSAVSTAYGVRPVINLRADTKFTYNSETTKGTMNDPYVV